MIQEKNKDTKLWILLCKVVFYVFVWIKICTLLQTFQPLFDNEDRADPKSVASIILGGGAGTRLFPLTSKRAKPAVRLPMIYII